MLVIRFLSAFVVLLALAAAPALAQVKVGSKNFTEQFILAELYAQALEANGV
ncbi:MAG: glycine betaine ABC transporter substrate-binding protein, partial [Casimicrobiaceae bacterium]